jgi:DNA-binding IclR family transcriptional regulator
MNLRTVYKTSEAAKLIDTSANTTSKCLSTLVKRGFVKKVRHGYWRKVKSL